MAPRPSIPTAQPPPDIPPLSMHSHEALTNYLRTFALWCRNMFQDRLPAHTALPGVLLQATDPPVGTTPKVFLLTVNSAGALSVIPQPLGGGLP
jgi:hypothetical protein